MVPTAWVYSIPFKFWSSQLPQHLCLHSTYQINNKTYPLTPGLHWHQYLHLCVSCTGYWIHTTSTNVVIKLRIIKTNHTLNTENISFEKLNSNKLQVTFLVHEPCKRQHVEEIWNIDPGLYYLQLLIGPAERGLHWTSNNSPRIQQGTLQSASQITQVSK